MSPRMAALLMPFVALGCVGVIGDDHDPPPGGHAGAGGDQELTAGPMPMRRLTRREYDNTVRDLLGERSSWGQTLSPDRDPGFSFSRPSVVTTLEAADLRGAAEALTAAAIPRLGRLLGCNPTAVGEPACARSFIESFGMRAYRRPLDRAEVDALVALYQTGRTPLALAFPQAVGLVIETILQSPGFLYRWELGPQAPAREGALVRLRSYEVASRLSYFLWSTMPDQALFDAAAANALDTSAQVEQQARRMLADPKARVSLADFFEEWLKLDELDELSKEYAGFNDALKSAMMQEARTFATHVAFDGDGRFGTLLTAPFSFVNNALARLYGITGVRDTTLSRLDLDAGQRSGMLTQAGFLARTGDPDGSHPVRRGKEIFEGFLCKVVPPPPGEVPPPRPVMPGLTTRQRFEDHAKNECAAGCHALFDAFGFAFEHYDGVGRYRTMDSGARVDSSGRVTIDGAARSFNDAPGLTRIVAESEEARRCFAVHWLRFAFRRLETEADGASIDAVMTRFARSGHDMREVLVSLTSTPSFRYRSLNPGEVMP